MDCEELDVDDLTLIGLLLNKAGQSIVDEFSYVNKLVFD
jgi:hypothetical protein